MKVSSDLMIARSWSQSGVVPLFPAVGGSWGCGVSAEKTDDEVAEESDGVSVGEEVGNTFECGDPADGLDEKPGVIQRRRTFHIV